ncbi:saccharopine dehydrogenase family protein [Actinocatenispora comari]|uniref:Saccharopine dehydrogenase n=1 Tax=Actinocatenispora comari TaxID=2807577 RepID=A0A8J4AIE9_9ACTN|nr:saccharopine dehydrogenase NADP-binding domain-containing protein [Actinocatenispora comari]GIL29199.1 saccharopine dehydrogenase [Actinocatenispora comari]GIL31846.1 saccharopine dehydrogenase [Actinocatenispora comari]
MKIAVYGASGFQAKLVLAELARRDIRPGLVGRNAERLHAAAVQVGLVDAERRVADTGDHDALVDAFCGYDVVINCAGPFTPSGHAVVRAVIAAGCHYVDTAGEQSYIKSVFDTFTDEARRAGVTVVPATNDACVPGDLIARLIAERIPRIDEMAVAHFIVGGGGPSRGSLRSLIETADAIAAGGLTYDDGDWHTGIPARRAAITLPGETQPTPVSALPLSEVVTIPRHVTVRHVESLVDAALSARLSTPLTAQMIDSLPEGPSDGARAAQRFTYLVDAAGPDGEHVRGTIRGRDTYGTTAVIAVEAARRLVADGASHGVLAPAQAYDPASFLDFLGQHGITWAITDSDISHSQPTS